MCRFALSSDKQHVTVENLSSPSCSGGASRPSQASRGISINWIIWGPVIGGLAALAIAGGGVLWYHKRAAKADLTATDVALPYVALLAADPRVQQ